MEPLGPEQGALQHTEPVLLVDDRQAELLEADIALHQRMGAHHQMDRAGFDFGELFPAPGAPGRARSAARRETATPAEAARC